MLRHKVLRHRCEHGFVGDALFAARRVEKELFAGELEAAGWAGATMTRRLSRMAGLRDCGRVS